MHILVVAMNYWPEKTAGRIRAELCEYMAKAGHQVSVATAFPHYPEWQIYKGYRGMIFQVERHNGVIIHRSYVLIPTKPNAWQRIWYDTSFTISSLFTSLSVNDVDLIMCVSPPLQLGITGYLLSRLKKAPLCLQIIDIVPDAAVELGMIQNERLIRLAHRLERWVYEHADRIIVISHGFADNLRSKGVPESKIHVFSDSVDTDAVRPIRENNGFRGMNNIRQNEFVVLYSGNIGGKQGLETLIKAANTLHHEDNIKFVIVGDGSARESLSALVEQLSLSNVIFLPLQHIERVSQMLSAADVLVLTQKANIVDIIIPSKLLTYMAAGQPVIAAANLQSEAARTIHLADCGKVVPPEDARALSEAILYVQAHPEDARKWGMNARSYAEKNFSKEFVLSKYERCFRDIK